jgi:hypothetical protein
MKTATGVWIVSISLGIWLWCIQPAQALDIRTCHLLNPDDLQSRAFVSTLPEKTLFQLKATFISYRTVAPSTLSKECLRLPGQVRCAIALAPNYRSINGFRESIFALVHQNKLRIGG